MSALDLLVLAERAAASGPHLTRVAARLPPKPAIWLRSVLREHLCRGGNLRGGVLQRLHVGGGWDGKGEMRCLLHG